VTEPSNQELSDLFDEAIAKLDKMNDHHPSMVWYAEAKFLYTLIPDLIEILEWAKQLPYQVEQENFLNLLEKILGGSNE